MKSVFSSGGGRGLEDDGARVALAAQARFSPGGVDDDDIGIIAGAQIAAMVDLVDVGRPPRRLAHEGRPGLAAWQPYRLPERQTLVIGEDRIRMVDDPRRWERELWGRAPYIQPGS